MGFEERFNDKNLYIEQSSIFYDIAHAMYAYRLWTHTTSASP